MAHLSVTGAQFEQLREVFLSNCYELVQEADGSVCLHFEAVTHQGVD